MTEAEARTEARLIIPCDLGVGKGIRTVLLDMITAALLKADREAREDAARTATEMWLETRTLPGAKEPVHIYDGSVQDAIRRKQ